MMMHRTVAVLDPGAAERRYEELVARVSGIRDFRARGAAYDLDAEDAAIYDAIRDLEFLLDRR